MANLFTIECTDEHQVRIPRRSILRRSRLNVPNARQRNHSYSGEGAQVFSPSPLDPSPVSLLGGYMGISVPTTMTNIFEDVEASGTSSSGRGQVHGQAKENDTTVTAIIESTSKTRHPSGSIC